eukprot:TRINITY_DN19903_c0_g1_i9.p6 TRINITY_DN19903_c0_g1~~TRINITY_DN19903_c0_g1_i9.p6  ORF type:complete len:115 (-),score=21.35 TRINITY_DN19903_c0_g1_i9:740-1084(-)
MDLTVRSFVDHSAGPGGIDGGCCEGGPGACLVDGAGQCVSAASHGRDGGDASLRDALQRFGEQLSDSAVGPVVLSAHYGAAGYGVLATLPADEEDRSFCCSVVECRCHQCVCGA